MIRSRKAALNFLSLNNPPKSCCENFRISNTALSTEPFGRPGPPFQPFLNKWLVCFGVRCGMLVLNVLSGLLTMGLITGFGMSQRCSFGSRHARLVNTTIKAHSR